MLEVGCIWVDTRDKAKRFLNVGPRYTLLGISWMGYGPYRERHGIVVGASSLSLTE